MDDSFPEIQRHGIPEGLEVPPLGPEWPQPGFRDPALPPDRAPDDLGRVFSPYFTTKSDEGGTGLGLVVCRRIMAQHGGHIEVDSRPGVGTTFTLLFPAEVEK